MMQPSTSMMKINWKWRNDCRSEQNLCNCAKKPEKNNQDFNGVWTRDLAITGAMLYQLSYEATDIGTRSIVGSYVPMKEMGVKLYELWKWNENEEMICAVNTCNLCNCVKKPEKNSGLQRGLNPWPRDYRCDALPTELWSHWRWEQVNCGFICSRKRNEC